VDGSDAWADEVVARVIDLRESLGRSVSVGISGVDCADLERMGGSSGVNERYARRYLPGQAIHLERDRPAQSADLVLRSNA
jgi:hypothetical protein